MPKANDPETIVEGHILSLQKEQNELAQLQDALSGNPEFTRFMELSKAVSNHMDVVRAAITAVMIPAYQAGNVDKSIKGEWGSVTITERDDFEIDEVTLPSKFIKKVPDVSKIRKTFQLEGKAPKGTTHIKKYGIMLKVKGVENDR